MKQQFRMPGSVADHGPNPSAPAAMGKREKYHPELLSSMQQFLLSLKQPQGLPAQAQPVEARSQRARCWRNRPRWPTLCTMTLQDQGDTASGQGQTLTGNRGKSMVGGVVGEPSPQGIEPPA